MSRSLAESGVGNRAGTGKRRRNEAANTIYQLSE